MAKVPPFRRKTLVLIGAQGVGRRSLKNKLMVSDPQRYGTTVPCECSRLLPQVPLGSLAVISSPNFEYIQVPFFKKKERKK